MAETNQHDWQPDPDPDQWDHYTCGCGDEAFDVLGILLPVSEFEASRTEQRFTSADIPELVARARDATAGPAPSPWQYDAILTLAERVAELEAALTGWHWQYHGRGTVPPESCPNHLCQSWQAIEKNSTQASPVMADNAGGSPKGARRSSSTAGGLLGGTGDSGNPSREGGADNESA